MRFTNISNRKALKSLQKVAGLYGLVVPCEDVQFPGAVVGHFTGGEPLRAVLPKVGGGGQMRNYQARKAWVVHTRDMACS